MRASDQLLTPGFFVAVVLAPVLTLAALVPSTAYADSTRAECGFSATAGTPPEVTSSCSFSQRQGFIYISIDGGPEFDLRPTAKGPGNFVDAAGRAVYRRSGLGDQGQLFRLPDRFLYIYWLRDQWACGAEQLASPDGCELNDGGIDFALHATAAGSLNELTVQVTGLEIVELMELHEIDGVAYKAEVADLDANGWPEVYVYISSAGSGSYGSLVAYGVNKGKSATAIYLPELSNDQVASKGYMGHDEFAVVENSLVRRFPVYLEGDTNSQPGGGMRQLQYKLVAGEAGWRLEVDKVVDY